VSARPWASAYLVDKTWRIGRVKINFSMRSTNGYMGRFGGGWDWKLGFQAGGHCVIFSLLVADLRITWGAT
jgi:hypothetical protein